MNPFWRLQSYDKGARVAQSVKRFVFVWRLAKYLFRRRANRAGGMLAKNIEWWKNIPMKIPAECVRVVWLSLLGCGGSQSISRAAENYPGFPQPQDSRSNASLEAELLGLTLVP